MNSSMDQPFASIVKTSTHDSMLLLLETSENERKHRKSVCNQHKTCCSNYVSNERNGTRFEVLSSLRTLRLGLQCVDTTRSRRASSVNSVTSREINDRHTICFTGTVRLLRNCSKIDRSQQPVHRVRRIENRVQAFDLDFAIFELALRRMTAQYS